MATPVPETVADTQSQFVPFDATLPSGVVSGDMLLAFVCVDNLGGSAYSITTAAGWNTLFNVQDDGQFCSSAVWWRIADGTEGATVTVAGTDSRAGLARIHRISGHNSAAPEFVNVLNAGSTTTHDPASLTPSGGSADYLYFANCYYDTYIAGVTGTPTGYTTGTLQTGNTGAEGTLAWGYKSTTASTSEDPSSYTLDSARNAVTTTLSIAPAAGGGVTVSPDNLTSSTSLTEPTLTQHNVMSVDSMSISTSLTEPVFTQNYQFPVNDLSLATSLTEPALTQNYQLSTDNITLSTSLESPTLIQQNILLVDDIAISSALTSPAFTQQNILSVNDLACSTTLTESALSVAGVLAAQNIAVSTQLTEAGLTQQNILLVDGITLSAELTESSLAGTALLSVNDLAVGTSITQPTLDVAFTILVDSLAVGIDLTSTAFTQHNILFVDDMSISSLLSTVNLGGAVISCLSGYVTITPKYTASTEISPRLSGTIEIE